MVDKNKIKFERKLKRLKLNKTWNYSHTRKTKSKKEKLKSINKNMGIEIMSIDNYINKILLLPMSLLDMPENIEDIVEAKISNVNKTQITIRSLDGKRRPKYFEEEYFKWLLYSGYIKIK